MRFCGAGQVLGDIVGGGIDRQAGLLGDGVVLHLCTGEHEFYFLANKDACINETAMRI